MQRTTAQETITVGSMDVRFLVQPADSDGSAAVFECYVPAHAAASASSAASALSSAAR